MTLQCEHNTTLASTKELYTTLVSTQETNATLQSLYRNTNLSVYTGTHLHTADIISTQTTLVSTRYPNTILQCLCSNPAQHCRLNTETQHNAKVSIQLYIAVSMP